MTAVVTGSAGFIGRTLVRLLLDAGERVVGIDRSPQPAEPGLTVLTSDLCDRDEAVLAALAGADRVFHLAARPGVRDRSAGVRAARHRDNVLATALVLDLVPLTTPLVVTSSSSVYGGSRGGRACVETDPLRPAGGYAESKAAAERLCMTRLEAGGPVAIARPFTVAGEGQRGDMALARWITAARDRRPLRLFGSERRSRDVTDVRQVAQALIALADREVSGVVNIGTGVGHTLRAMVDAIAAALDTEVRTVLEPADPEEVADTLADTRRLAAAIGWVPETDLPALVARQVSVAGEAAGEVAVAR